MSTASRKRRATRRIVAAVASVVTIALIAMAILLTRSTAERPNDSGTRRLADAYRLAPVPSRKG